MVWVVGCGARRQAPSPAFEGPIHVEAGPVSPSSGAAIELRVTNQSMFVLEVASIDWSLTRAEGVCAEQEAQLVGVVLSPQTHTAARLAGSTRCAGASSLAVAGTVHIVGPSGYRRVEVFSLSRVQVTAPALEHP